VITIGSLFSGIGGIDLAFQNAGFDIAWQVEIDEFCQQVLEKNFPTVPKYRDIYECADLPYVDVITAGFPCQPFSVAGLRKGADDERFLIPRMIEVIDYVQPKMVFLENVPGFASLNDGNEFKQLLRTLAKMGYDAQWGHCRASDIGAPHQRERWFCVAYTNSKRRGKVGEYSQQIRERTERTGDVDDTDHSGCKPKKSIPRSANNKDINRKHSSSKSQRYNLKSRASLAELGNTKSKCRQGYRQARKQVTSARTGTWLHRSTGCRRKQTAQFKSGLGRVVDGLSGGLHRPLIYDVTGHQFPAPRGVPQYDFEPPRVTDRKDLRRDRIKALGNAVVPQVIYPIAVEMYKYLMGENE
jgi:DNA (cytosine-5)-methyltransferase 1